MQINSTFAKERVKLPEEELIPEAVRTSLPRAYLSLIILSRAIMSLRQHARFPTRANDALLPAPSPPASRMCSRTDDLI